MADNKEREDKQVMLLSGDRALPHDVNAEVAVLGSMLLAPEEAIDVACRLVPKAFYNEKHRIIFKALLELNENADSSIDLITLGDQLRRKGDFNKAGGEDYLIHLMNSMPTAANIETYTQIVFENFTLRRLISAGSDIVNKSFDQTTPVKELMDTIEQEIMDIGNAQSKKDYVVLKDLMKGVAIHLDELANSDQMATGLSTGFADLDKMIFGLKESNMVVLAARPSIGKTALALNIAAHVAIESENPQPVGIFSLEMSAKELATRLLVSTSKVSIQAIKDNRLSTSQWQHIMQVCDDLKQAPIYIDDTAQIDILELRAKARRMKREHDIKLIVIDYLQLMTATVAGNSSREQEVAKMSGTIKAIAKELEIPVLVLAQLNRQAEQAGQRPKLSHLRESGSIEQDADIVMILHRERDAQHEATEEDYDRGLKSEIIIAKHRAGATGIVPVMFMPKIIQFVNYTGIDDSDVPMA
ncbi:MAG: replicative DNA helicase [Lentisphaeria bacterium]|nr:replicative DNA helicase [Lentisphaeria bacterium]